MIYSGQRKILLGGINLDSSEQSSTDNGPVLTAAETLDWNYVWW
jgi:hypothetical protein